MTQERIKLTIKSLTRTSVQWTLRVLNSIKASIQQIDDTIQRVNSLAAKFELNISTEKIRCSSCEIELTFLGENYDTFFRQVKGLSDINPSLCNEFIINIADCFYNFPIEVFIKMISIVIGTSPEDAKQMILETIGNKSEIEHLRMGNSKL